MGEWSKRVARGLLAWAAAVGCWAGGCGAAAPDATEQSAAQTRQAGATLAPRTIPKFSDALVIPPAFAPRVISGLHHRRGLVHEYTVSVRQFSEQILPAGFPATTVWGYAGEVIDPDTGRATFVQNAPGPTFEAVRGIPIRVRWRNELHGYHLLPVDPTIDFADPGGLAAPSPPFPPFPPGFRRAQRPVPIVTHLHGGEDAPDSDGGPLAWFTSDGITGPGFKSTLYTYPNGQPATTLFYHDHALGETRLNVQAGLAGFYLIRDPDDPIAPLLPPRRRELPIAIQDRTFNADGSIFYPSAGPNPNLHPYWVAEFFGDAIMVNGRTWPTAEVERAQYRLLVVNGSNARFYRLRLSNGEPFTQIGGDGGYLPAPVVLPTVVLAPGERADLLVDFSRMPPGSRVILENDAPTPFPGGEPVDPDTTGQIMRFTVARGPARPPRPLPPVLNRIARLVPDSPSRTLTLEELSGAGGPESILIDGLHFTAPASETPRVGSTEEWIVANLTVDSHPMHLHLVQFQLYGRQAFDATRYAADWRALNGDPPLDHPAVPLDVRSYLRGRASGPDANETGWKDTVRMNPGEVTRILVRFAPIGAPPTAPGENRYPFDPTEAPGYVWHCHILEHEDNDMMRPLLIDR